MLPESHDQVMPPRGRMLYFRVASVAAALCFMFWHSSHRSNQIPPSAPAASLKQWDTTVGGGRHLLSNDNSSEDQGADNCTSLRHFQGYNSSCDFVRQECASKRVLMDYLAFTLCDLGRIKVGQIVK